MAVDGECTTQRVGVIPTNPVISSSATNIPVNPLPGCCSDFVLRVLADTSGLPLQNDVSSVIWWFDPIVTSAYLYLKKWVDGAWEQVAAITDNTYGTLGSYGYYVNDAGQKFVSLEVSWAAVLAAFGEGSYKITNTYTIPLGSPASVDLDSHEYCLKTYSPALANGTVRLEYWLGGTTADIEDDTKIKDFGTLNIYNSLRINGYFGYPKSTYKEEDIQYDNGQFQYVEDEQLPTYKCKLKLLPFFIHEILRTDFMMADTLAITDYNAKNNGVFIQKYVRKDSGYEPKWYELQCNLASVELQFKPAYNRTQKLRQ